MRVNTFKVCVYLSIYPLILLRCNARAYFLVFENRENLLQDCYFLSFAKTYYSIVALLEHTSPKMENSLKTVPRIVIPSKLLNFFFLQCTGKCDTKL
jgi:hypothetical protein